MHFIVLIVGSGAVYFTIPNQLYGSANECTAKEQVWWDNQAGPEAPRATVKCLQAWIGSAIKLPDGQFAVIPQNMTEQFKRQP